MEKTRCIRHALFSWIVIWGWAGCVDSTVEQSAESAADIGSKPVDALFIDDVSEETGEPTGPPCLVDSDCANVFVGLGSCEVAVCEQSEAIWGQCRHQSVQNGEPCDDGDVCTTVDSCSNGVCTGNQPLNCDDGQTCTADVCDSDSGCVHEPASDLSCDDGNPCTVDDG